MAAQIETSERKIGQRIDETEETLEQKIGQIEKTLEQKIEKTKQELGRGINHAQTIAAGAPLVILDDPKKVSLMQECLKAYAACITSGGGASCLKGKGYITCRFQLLIVT